MTEEDLDSEALVFRHIDRVMRTASLDLESLSGGGGQAVMDTDTWSHRVLYATEFFHAFLKPTMTDEEYQEIKNKANGTTDNFKNPYEKVKVARYIFQQDVEHLHKNNMIFQESSDLVIEDESDDSMVEPEDSEVEEEVIE